MVLVTFMVFLNSFMVFLKIVYGHSQNELGFPTHFLIDMLMDIITNLFYNRFAYTK